MHIEIIDIKLNPTKRSLGTVLVRYENLILKCDLVIHVKSDKLWIRMPEVWFTPVRKTRFCYWTSKELSDDFQQSVIMQLANEHGITAEKLKALRVESKKKNK